MTVSTEINLTSWLPIIGVITAAVIAATAAITGAFISRTVKISEFRQAWINDLRSDISLFISKAHEWMDLYLNLNNTATNKEEKPKLAEALERLKYDSFHVVRRIELRFKPDDDQGNVLVKKLNNLLNPQALPSPHGRFEWRNLADEAVSHARLLLKTEWEKTKHPWILRRWFRIRTLK